MTVRVYAKWGIFMRRHEIAYDNVNYQITKQLNGLMTVSQGKRKLVKQKHGTVISTKEKAKIEFISAFELSKNALRTYTSTGTTKFLNFDLAFS